ncbi:MAG: hypothetical protein LBI14_10915 [Treponema sp.]|jgi:hypothetical protein|nr:hypothetical protein [Treponema sp.]
MIFRHCGLVLFFSIVFFMITPAVLSAQTASRGDAAAAALYVQWAEDAINRGSWSEALIVLERGVDYANVSSDISYLLALARSYFQRPVGAVLEAVRRAIGTDRWNNYLPEDALLLEAEQLIILKSYGEALNILTGVSESPQSARLRLLALRFSSRTDEFLRYTEETFNRFPRETEPIRIFLDYLRVEDIYGLYPRQSERELFSLIERRLPSLLPLDPELAWMAAPFIRDTAEARRLVAAYRAVNEPVPASFPITLNLGLVDERIILEELFTPQNRAVGLDIFLLDTIWDLLGDEGREIFRRNLLQYSGVIKIDANFDGISDAFVAYQTGLPVSYQADDNQDRVPELIVEFEVGLPTFALIALPPEVSFGRSVVSEEAVRRIRINWEQYPAVLNAELEGERFIFRPFSFFYAPLQFREYPTQVLQNQFSLDYSGGTVQARNILFPERNTMIAALTRRVLIANSYQVERASAEFSGAVEVIELNSSIPVRAREYLDGRMISETDFLRGRPIAQRVDLDLDGRLETVRHFRRSSLTQDDGTLVPPEILLDYERDYDYAQSDWAGDGNYEFQYY